MSNIKTVSRLAEVSVATASRAFTDPHKLSAKTLKRVQDAAKQVNYTPNSMARQFRNKQSNTVVVIVPDLANAFFSRVLSGIESAATEAGLSLLLSDSHDDLAIERSCLDMVRAKRADGIIQLGARSLEVLAQGDATRGIPFVHAIEPSMGSISPSVSINNALAAEEVVDYIIAQGHRKIGVLAGREDSGITQRRLDGYKSALSNHGIRFDPQIVEYEFYSLKGGELAAGRLLQKRQELTAMFCMSDEIAIGAMHAARGRGISIPDDLSITGFDNIEIGGYIEPPLTTVHQPARRMGELAMRIMVDLIGGALPPTDAHILPAELIVRGSVQQLS